MYETRYQTVEAIQRERRAEAEEARLADLSLRWQHARAAQGRAHAPSLAARVHAVEAAIVRALQHHGPMAPPHRPIAQH